MIRLLNDKHEDLYIDWPAFWERDRSERVWAFEPILAKERGHAIYAPHKTGKSLVSLWMAADMAVNHRNLLVVYFDYEMTEDDLYERLSDMGYGPDTDFSRLKYALLPSLDPLDVEAGARQFLGLIRYQVQAHPKLHVVVVIDTMGRAVQGDENSADTYRNFYRHTGLALKQEKVTWVRLDHAGKDLERGQRGSSAKGDDVDVVWQLKPSGDHGYMLQRMATRIAWVPERVALVGSEEPVRFKPVANLNMNGVEAVVALLDELGVGTDTTAEALKALRANGHSKRRQTVSSAQQIRRERDIRAAERSRNARNGDAQIVPFPSS